MSWSEFKKVSKGISVHTITTSYLLRLCLCILFMYMYPSSSHNLLVILATVSQKVESVTSGGNLHTLYRTYE